MTDYLQREKERLEKATEEILRDIERQEQRAEYKRMIDDAIREHDRQIVLDIQTLFNGNPIAMNSLTDEIIKSLINGQQKRRK